MPLFAAISRSATALCVATLLACSAAPEVSPQTSNGADNTPTSPKSLISSAVDDVLRSSSAVLGMVCTPGDRAFCHYQGACNATGDACECDDPVHRSPDDSCNTWHQAVVPAGLTCLPGDRSYCHWQGACDNTGSGCECDDSDHYDATEQCASWHPSVVPAGLTCLPGDREFCSWQGACDTAGQACLCDDPGHYDADEMCAVYHDAIVPPSLFCLPGDRASCSHHGSCDPAGLSCACDNDWWQGDACEVPKDSCPGYGTQPPPVYFSDEVCSGNGTCVAADTCDCEPGFGGDACAAVDCDSGFAGPDCTLECPGGANTPCGFGVQHLADIVPLLFAGQGGGGEREGSITTFDGELYFNANDGTSGAELWRSDGKTATRVADINPTSSSDPKWLADADGTLFFTANKGTGGVQLWTWDGITTTEIALNPFGGINPHDLTPVGSRVVFDTTQGMWGSDGTVSGTVALGAPSGQNVVGGRDLVFFTVLNSLWQSDGTVLGTRPTAPFGTPHDFVAAGGDVYFVDGTDLWRADGTTADLSIVLDLAASGLTSASNLVFAADRVFFESGSDMWAADLTTGTAERVLDTVGFVEDLVAVGDLAFFKAGGGVYASDGTAAGTLQVHTFHPSCGINKLFSIAPIGDTAIFHGCDGTGGTGLGHEMWQSDGSLSGTSIIQDTAPGTASFAPSLVGYTGTAILSMGTVPGTTDLATFSVTARGTCDDGLDGLGTCECDPAFDGPGCTCGDGLLDPGESCDDGNRLDGDGCASDCGIAP